MGLLRRALMAGGVSTPVAEVDPYYANVVSLLNFVGANNSPVFTDQKGKPWTRYGDAKIDTSAGFNAGRFDGTGDYIDTPSHADFAFGSGDFTLEVIVQFVGYANLNGGYYTEQLLSKDTAIASGRSFGMSVVGTATTIDSLNFIIFTNNTTYVIATGAFSFALDTTYHLEVTRSGNTLRLYVDGVQVGTATYTGSVQVTSSVVRTGALMYDATFKYESNTRILAQRITKGVSRHPAGATFTPPTAPLPVGGGDPYYENVVALLKGRTFTDERTGVAWTVAGNTNIASGKIVLDGASDYLYRNLAATLAIAATSVYTVEMVVNANALSGGRGLANQSITGTNNQGISISHTGTTVNCDNGNVGGTGPSAGVMATSADVHLAFVSDGTNTKAYRDGVLQDTYVGVTGVGYTLAKIYLGGYPNGGLSTTFNGKILAYRFTWGVARYTANFTPPASFGAGTVTWNVNDKGTNLTLSGGNLIATKSGSSVTQATVRATHGYSSGRRYFEVVMAGTAASPFSEIGILRETDALPNYLDLAANAYCYYQETGSKYNNAVGAAYGAPYADGDVIGVDLNMDAGTLEFFKNNVSQGIAYTGLSGTFYPATAVFRTAATHTGRFKRSSFTYAPPAGSLPWGE